MIHSHTDPYLLDLWIKVSNGNIWDVRILKFTDIKMYIYMYIKMYNIKIEKEKKYFVNFSS